MAADLASARSDLAAAKAKAAEVCPDYNRTFVSYGGSCDSSSKLSPGFYRTGQRYFFPVGFFLGFFLGEYAYMILMSGLAVILF
jgi:hypothetical protein